MSYRSSVTVNFVCATKFCLDPPFFNSSSLRALSAQYSAHHTSRKSQLARFPAHPFWRPDGDCKIGIEEAWVPNKLKPRDALHVWKSMPPTRSRLEGFGRHFELSFFGFLQHLYSYFYLLNFILHGFRRSRSN